MKVPTSVEPERSAMNHHSQWQCGEIIDILRSDADLWAGAGLRDPFSFFIILGLKGLLLCMTSLYAICERPLYQFSNQKPPRLLLIFGKQQAALQL